MSSQSDFDLFVELERRNLIGCHDHQGQMNDTCPFDVCLLCNPPQPNVKKVSKEMLDHFREKHKDVVAALIMGA